MKKFKINISATPLLLLLTLGVTGCFESSEERQREAAATFQEALKITNLYNNYPSAAKHARESMPTEKDIDGKWEKYYTTIVPIVNNDDLYNEIYSWRDLKRYYIWQYRPEETYLKIPGEYDFGWETRLLSYYNFCNQTQLDNITATLEQNRLGLSGQKCFVLTEQQFNEKICAEVPECANSEFALPVPEKENYRLFYHMTEKLQH